MTRLGSARRPFRLGSIRSSRETRMSRRMSSHPRHHLGGVIRFRLAAVAARIKSVQSPLCPHTGAKADIIRGPSWGMSDKTQAEHNESAYPPIADMGADIDFCRSGPHQTSLRAPNAQSQWRVSAYPAHGCLREAADEHRLVQRLSQKCGRAIL